MTFISLQKIVAMVLFETGSFFFQENCKNFKVIQIIYLRIVSYHAETIKYYNKIRIWI